MAQRGVGSRIAGLVNARSVGVTCFGLGIVAYWGLRGQEAYFAALVPLFLIGIAGLLLGYSTGYEQGVADATGAETPGRED